MELARSIPDFVLQPLGRLSLGPNHLLWCHSRTLCGSEHWGRYSPAAMTDYIERLAYSQGHSLAGGFDVLQNVQAVDGLDWPAWQQLASYVREQLPTFNRRIRRHAIVVPHGIVGGLIAGMLPFLQPRYSFRFFLSTASAVEWLDRPELPTVLDEVRGVFDAARNLPPVVQQLQIWLDDSLTEASIDSAARALRLSPRSLQRALRDAGTNFSDELTAARVRAARAQLEEGDENVATIARRVGCNSSSRLSAVFARQVGETPMQYRLRRRRA